MGTIIILTISIAISIKLTSTIVPAYTFIMKGVIIGATIVVTAVTVTDSTKLAFAIYAITFDANPLEQQPIKMTPAAISGSKLKTRVSKKPTNGMIVNWVAK